MSDMTHSHAAVAVSAEDRLHDIPHAREVTLEYTHRRRPQSRWAALGGVILTVAGAVGMAVFAGGSADSKSGGETGIGVGIFVGLLLLSWGLNQWRCCIVAGRLVSGDPVRVWGTGRPGHIVALYSPNGDAGFCGRLRMKEAILPASSRGSGPRTA